MYFCRLRYFWLLLHAANYLMYISLTLLHFWKKNASQIWFWWKTVKHVFKGHSKERTSCHQGTLFIMGVSHLPRVKTVLRNLWPSRDTCLIDTLSLGYWGVPCRRFSLYSKRCIQRTLQKEGTLDQRILSIMSYLFSVNCDEGTPVMCRQVFLIFEDRLNCSTWTL